MLDHTDLWTSSMAGALITVDKYTIHNGGSSDK